MAGFYPTQKQRDYDLPVSSETLGLLMAAGLEGVELLRVVAAIDADNQPKVRSSNAIRQQSPQTIPLLTERRQKGM